MVAQLPTNPNDLMYHQIVVVLVNIQGDGHNRFDEAKAQYAGSSKYKEYFRFVTLGPNEMPADPKKGGGMDQGEHNADTWRFDTEG
jgi:hypothetical protein